MIIITHTLTYLVDVNFDDDKTYINDSNKKIVQYVLVRYTDAVIKIFVICI